MTETALLTQWILFKEEDDPDSTLFRKILTTNFFVSGEKHSVVLGGSACREWLDNEESIIEELIKAIKNGVSTEDQLAISHKYPFSSKLTSHPGEGVKLISIHFQESSNEENDDKPKETIEENIGFDDSITLSDMSTDMLDDSLISVKSVDIELEQSESTEIMCQDILQDLINQVTAVNKGESKIIVKENGTDTNSKDNKVPLETYGKLNVKVKAEVKLLKQSIKAKDDEIKSLKKSLSDLQAKLKAETKKTKKQDKCKFGNKCRYVHEKEHVPPRFKYNTRDKVDKSKSVFRRDYSEISSHTVPTVRNTTTDSVNLQELFTATKDLQQNTKSFLEQMSKQMSFLMTHVLQEK